MMCDVPEWGIVGPKRLRDRVMVIAILAMIIGLHVLVMGLCTLSRHL